MHKLTGGTLFSGIGAPEAAAPKIDWRWCAEIDPFASAVLAERFPHLLNLGDVRKIKPAAIEPVDLVVFGSPCQSFSVAGKRQGLDDPRGNLAFVALGLIGRIRPRWVVFENVPGLLSSERGATLAPSSGRWQNAGMGSPTEFWTLSSSECPSAADACSLSDVLETGELPQRFYLSAKACAGILRRAETRGKTLPETLRLCLFAQAAAAPRTVAASAAPAIRR